MSRGFGRAGWAWAAALFLFAQTASASWAGPAQPASLEYPVKATFLYKFAPFVTWPDSAYGSPNAPFSLCVLGEDPFGSLLDQATSGQRVGPHPIVVRRLQKVDKGSGCQILYLGASKGQADTDAAAALKGTPVLTVSDSATDPGLGVIQFVVQDNRVRFRIDNQAAAQAGLVISSKLLNLALASPRRGT